MNLPDWLTLSATSGIGSGKITAIVSKCTARAARRSTTFSVKTESGSSRLVRVVQNGIAEFVKITTEDIIIPAVIDGVGTIAINGMSNSAILSVYTSGKLKLKSSAFKVTDEDGMDIPFVSGVAIDGDPGVRAQYSFVLVFNYDENTTAEKLETTVTVSTQSGSSASLAITQLAGESADTLYPHFTNNSTRVVDAAGASNIEPGLVVYNPNNMPWDVIATPADGVTITKGTTDDSMTPVTVAVGAYDDKENDRNFTLYLVPSGAVDISVVYSVVSIKQKAAPVNPYIEGGESKASYAGGLVTLRIIDQKSIGWYPQSIFKDDADVEIVDNPCEVKITGVSDNGISYTDADVESVFAEETGNTKIVGDGIVKVRINSSYGEDYSATINLCVTKNDITSTPYDYVVIGVTNIPQFDFEDYEIVLGPDNATVSDSLLTIGNPNSVPFIVTTSNNPAINRKATIYAEGFMVYDDTDYMGASVLSDSSLALDITAIERGGFSIYLKSEDGTIIFDTIEVKVYRQPAIKFATESNRLNPIILHVTEPITNIATVYSHYAGYSHEPSYSNSDIMSDARVSYTLESGEPGSVLFETNSAANSVKVTGFQVVGQEQSNMVVIRATYEGSEQEFYKSAYAEYAIAVVRTAAYVRINNLDADKNYMSLYRPATADMPKTKRVQYAILVDKYSAYGVRDSIVEYATLFPQDIACVTFTANEATQSAEPYLSINGDEITAEIVPTQEGPTLIPVNISLNTTSHFVQSVTGEYPSSFNVRVLANTHYLLRVVPSTADWADEQIDVYGNTRHYLYSNSQASGSGASPYKLYISLTNDVSNGNNDVSMNHVISFMDASGGTYSTESGLENVIFENEMILVKRTGTYAINTSAETHEVTVALKSNPNAGRSTLFTIRASADGVALENFFVVYITQQGEQSRSYSLEPDGSEVCSDGMQLDWWIDNVLTRENEWIPCYAGTHDFPLILKANIPSSQTLEYPLEGQTIVPSYEYYVDDGAGWRAPTQEEAFQWLSLEPVDDAYDIVTGSGGKANALLSWNANSDDTLKRKCEMTLTCTLKDSLGNVTSHSVVSENVIGGFIQQRYALKLTVVFVNISDEVINSRTVLENYTEETAGCVAKCYLNENEIESGTAGLVVRYSASDGSKVTINENTGLISNLHAGYATVTAYATYDDGESDYSAEGSYSLTIEKVKNNTTIYPTIPTGLVYRNTETHTISAYSDSGAEVNIAIVNDDTGALVLGQRSVVEENGRIVTKQEFTLLSPAVAEATTPHTKVATTGSGIEIRFTCSATDDYNSGITNGYLTIAKFQDAVLGWDEDNNGSNYVVVGQPGKVYRLRTSTGNAPIGVGITWAPNIPGDIYHQYDPVAITHPYNNDPFKYMVTAIENKQESGPEYITLYANLKHDDINYALPPLEAARSEGFYIYKAGLGPSTNQRTVSFANNEYNVAVGASPTNTSLVFSPSNATGGTKTYSSVYGNEYISVNSSTGAITANKATGSAQYIKVVVEPYGGYDGCSATALVNVGKKQTSISFTPSSLSLEVGETKSFTAVATSGASITYTAYGYNDKISISKYNGQCRVTGLSAGQAQIKAHCDATEEWSSKDEYFTVNVGAVQQQCNIVISPDAFVMNSNGTLNLSTYISTLWPESGTTVTYAKSPNNTTAISVGVSSGIVSASTVAQSQSVSVIVTASKEGYIDKSITVGITVNPSQNNTRTIQLNPTRDSLYEENEDGEHYPYYLDLNPSVNPSGGTITYESNNNYVEVLSNGRVIARQGSAGTSATITVRCTEMGYDPAIATKLIPVYAVPDSGSSEPVTSQDYILFHPELQETKRILMTEIYENLATSQSGRPVSFASSNGTIAHAMAGRVTIPSDAATGTVTLTLTLESSPSVSETCVMNVTTVIGDSKNGRNITWNSKAQTINVNRGDTFIITPKTDTTVALSSRLTIPNSVNTTIEKYTHWNTADSTMARVAGGVVTPVAANANTVQIKARLRQETIDNITWLANSGYYTLLVSKVTRAITFLYGEPKYVVPTGDGLTQVPAYSNFNIVERIEPNYGTVVYSSNNWDPYSSTGVAKVDSSTGIVYPGPSIGEATITATLAGDDRYNEVSKFYIVETNAYELVAFINGSQITPSTEIPLSGEGGSVTLTFRYYHTALGQYSRMAYADTFEQLSLYTCICATQGTTAESHTATFNFGRNFSNQSVDRTILVRSVFGQAVCQINVKQAQGAGQAGDTRYSSYDITRGNNDDITHNSVYGHSDPYNSTTHTVDLDMLNKTILGCSPWTIGWDSLLSNAAGNDELSTSGPNDRLTHETGGFGPVWFEVYSYIGGAARITTASTGYPANICYQVQYWTGTTDSSGEWTTDLSKTPDAVYQSGYWCGVYVGDGNYHIGSYSPSQSGIINLGSTGKVFPHIEWKANGTGITRWARVIFSYPNYEHETSPIYIATIMQQA